MEWLNEDLKGGIKKIFEPKYKRELSELEVLEIASNLVSYIEHYSKFIWRMKNESRI